jgi:hypothetical protein
MTVGQQLQAIQLWNQMFDGVWLYYLTEEDSDARDSPAVDEPHPENEPPIED